MSWWRKEGDDFRAAAQVDAKLLKRDHGRVIGIEIAAVMQLGEAGRFRPPPWLLGRAHCEPGWY